MGWFFVWETGAPRPPPAKEHSTHAAAASRVSSRLGPDAYHYTTLYNLGEWRWSSPVLIELFFYFFFFSRKEKHGFDFFVTTRSAVTTAGHQYIDPGESHAPRTHRRANKSGIGVGIPTTTTTKTIARRRLFSEKRGAPAFGRPGVRWHRGRSGASACASAEFLFYCCSCRKRSTHARGKATHVSLPTERKSERPGWDDTARWERVSEQKTKKPTQQITHDRAFAWYITTIAIVIIL